MVESFAVRVLLDASIAALIVGSLVEVAADVRQSGLPEFLPTPLSNLPPCDPATVLALGGLVGLAVGVLLTGPLPGGRVFVGFIAIVAFLFSSGFFIGGNTSEEGSTHG
jgi:hypothetical protein